MKKYLFTVVALCVATVGMAQSSMLATLSHEGEISTYYGARALVEAYNAAANGDVITLSSGSFVCTNIEKGLTIRGAGMAVDSTAQTEPTVITGDFTINIPDSVTSRLTLEGIYHNHTITYSGTLMNATFIKDRFKEILYSGGGGVVQNLTMINCRVSNTLKCGDNSSISCVNCIVWEPYGYSSTTSNFEFANCILYRNDWDTSEAPKSSSFKNCFIHTNSNYHLISSNTAYNCVSNYANMFEEMPNTTNKGGKQYEEIYKTFRGTYNDNELFELTDDAKTSLLGLDGKEVGIYGGMMPYSSTPTNPQITKCNVAAKSTADGKLSVDITVGSSDAE